MIRYPQALDDIEVAIGEDWLTRAAARSALFAAAGKYFEELISDAGVKTPLKPFWSEVKDHYIKRQHGKCVYCETALEWGEYAGVQWDLEHFRPKSAVRAWPGRSSKLRSKYSEFPLGAAFNGYHQLAYSPHNYAASCKTCNSSLKRDYFPIASQRTQGGRLPSGYLTERPYLVYPPRQ